MAEDLRELEERLWRLEERLAERERERPDPWANQPVVVGGAPEPRRPAGPQMFPDSEPAVWGEIATEVGSGKYTFKEKVLTDGTTWTDKTGGRTGDCYEANDLEHIAVGKIIKIRVEYDTSGNLRYVFDLSTCIPPGTADNQMLLWDETTDKAWEPTAPTEITVVTAFQVTGVTLQVKTRTAKVVVAGAESGWTTAHTGKECP